MENKVLDIHYKDFVKTIKDRVNQAQYEAFKRVNSEIIELYWDLGRLIVQKQEEYA